MTTQNLMSSTVDQVGGTHYTDGAIKCPHCDAVLQHWDVYEAFPYLIGCATKYLWRLAFKDGLTGVRKAISYLQKYVEVEEAKQLRASAQQGVRSRRTR